MKNKNIIKELCLSYAMELETVQNYIAASVNLDGVRSEVIKKALAADIAVEVQHAQQLATQPEVSSTAQGNDRRRRRAQVWLTKSKLAGCC